MALIASGVVPVKAIWTLEHVFPMNGYFDAESERR